MKKIFYVFGVTTLLFACGSSSEEQEKLENDDVSETIESTDEDLLASTTIDPRTFGGSKHEDQLFMDEIRPEDIAEDEPVLGCYVGEFGKNMINITLYKVENQTAEGYSVCAGNFRRIKGTFASLSDSEMNFEMDEPGDDQYDGHFSFTLNTDSKEIKGKWKAFKSKGNSEKSYKLEKRYFQYDPEVGDWPESSTRLLTDDDVNNLNEDQLATMRNEIYARHGYSFKDKEWRYYFEGRDWYMPMGIDIRDKLTDTEVENIELIYLYESYYEDYYDDYGR